MGSVTIGNLDEEVIARLEERARRNNHSLEAELREIVTQAVPRRLSREEVIAEADRIQGHDARHPSNGQRGSHPGGP